MLTCTVKLWTEQKRTLMTVAWKIMADCKTAAADNENGRGNRCAGSYIGGKVSSVSS